MNSTINEYKLNLKKEQDQHQDFPYKNPLNFYQLALNFVLIYWRELRMMAIFSKKKMHRKFMKDYWIILLGIWLKNIRMFRKDLLLLIAFQYLFIGISMIKNFK